MHTSQGPAALFTHLLGAHPIIAHFIQRLNLRDIVCSQVGTGRERLIDHGEALTALVHNILDSPAPLYRIAQWADPMAPASFGFSEEQKKALNDDRIARMLDALVSERGRGIWFALALRIIRQFDLATARMHQDTTTVTFHGGYEQSVGEPRITRGHNKDHRPDLKQLVFGLTVSSDGAVPVHHQVLSGNRTDDRSHRSNLEELRQILGTHDFIYVADGKLATSANLQDIHRHGGKFVTVLPRTRGEDKRFRQELRQTPVRWKRIMTLPNKRHLDGPPDMFYSCKGLDRTAEGFRLVWIRSSAKAQHDEAVRERNLEKALMDLAMLQPRLNRRRLKSKKAIQQAVRQILKQTATLPFIRIKLTAGFLQQYQRLKPGRPSAKDPVRVWRRRIWTLKIQRDNKAVRAEKRTDGVFPLVANMAKAAKRELLSIYKYQPYVEKRFSQIKSDLEVAPVYLKKALRCAGLVHAYFVALAVASLMERSVRQGMMRHNIKSLPLLPEGRSTATPTCPRILEAFRAVSWHEFKRGEEILRFPIKLSSLQKQLLKLLDVPEGLYR